MGQLSTIVVIIVMGVLAGTNISAFSQVYVRGSSLVERLLDPEPDGVAMDQSAIPSSLTKDYLHELIRQAKLELDKLSVAERSLPYKTEPPQDNVQLFSSVMEQEDTDCKHHRVKALLPDNKRALFLFESMTLSILRKIKSKKAYQTDELLSAKCGRYKANGRIYYEFTFIAKQIDAAKSVHPLNFMYKPSSLDCIAMILVKPNEVVSVKCKPLDYSRGFKLPSRGILTGGGPLGLVQPPGSPPIPKLNPMLSPADPKVKRAFVTVGDAIKKAFILARKGTKPESFHVNPIISATRRDTANCAVKFNVREEGASDLWNCLAEIARYEQESPIWIRLIIMDCQKSAGTPKFTALASTDNRVPFRIRFYENKQ